jgi:hypothetical protein
LYDHPAVSHTFIKPKDNPIPAGSAETPVLININRKNILDKLYIDNLVFKHPVALLYSTLFTYNFPSVMQLFISLFIFTSLLTQQVSTPIGHPQVSQRLHTRRKYHTRLVGTTDKHWAKLQTKYNNGLAYGKGKQLRCKPM